MVGNNSPSQMVRVARFGKKIQLFYGNFTIMILPELHMTTGERVNEVHLDNSVIVKALICRKIVMAIGEYLKNSNFYIVFGEN